MALRVEMGLPLEVDLDDEYAMLVQGRIERAVQVAPDVSEVRVFFA